MACGGCRKRAQKAYNDNARTVRKSGRQKSQAAKEYMELLRKARQRNNR